MARVRLSRYEAEEGSLPPLCLCCGASATRLVEKSFSWWPPWILVLLITGPFWFLAALAFSRRMHTRMPLCEVHRNHWMWRSWFVYGAFPILVLLGIGTIALVGDAGGSSRVVAGLACFGTGVVVVGWLFSAILLQQLAIHASEITDRSIILTNLSPRFVEAVERERRLARGEGTQGPHRQAAANRRPRP
jgi:hypothetical protein